MAKTTNQPGLEYQKRAPSVRRGAVAIPPPPCSAPSAPLRSPLPTLLHPPTSAPGSPPRLLSIRPDPSALSGTPGLSSLSCFWGGSLTSPKAAALQRHGHGKGTASSLGGEGSISCPLFSRPFQLWAPRWGNTNLAPWSLL